jgi:hypothetical protein
LKKLPLRFRLDAPEDAEVVEHATGQVDVRRGFGRERREFFLQWRAPRDVLRLRQIANS